MLFSLIHFFPRKKIDKIFAPPGCLTFFSLDSQFRSIDALYTKPYARVGAYLTGVWVGNYLSKMNRRWNISKVSYFTSLQSIYEYFALLGYIFCYVIWMHLSWSNFGVWTTIQKCRKPMGVDSVSSYGENALGHSDCIYDRRWLNGIQER